MSYRSRRKRLLPSMKCFIILVIILNAQKMYGAIPVFKAHLKLGGYVQWHVIDGGNSLNLNHESYFRRARLYLSGRLDPKIHYKIEYDFAYPGNWTNIWISYKRAHNYFKLGQFYPGFNSIYNTSAVNLWFNERALPVKAFNPNYKRGITYHFLEKQWNLGASIFLPGTQTQDKIKKPYGATLRILYIPLHTKRKLFQVGIGDWYQYNNTSHVFQFSTIPEASGFRSVKTIKTPLLQDISYYNVFNTDSLIQYNRFASEIGYFHTQVSSGITHMLHFNGWYSQFSYFLTPNTLSYQMATGTFGAPHSLKQAYQMVFRISSLNLNSRDIHGGKEINLTLGLNTYFSLFKVGVNYIYANVYHSVTSMNGVTNIILAKLQVVL